MNELQVLDRMATTDYRNSHKKSGKGAEYHAKFFNNPHRATIWEIEKRALRRIIREHFSHRKVRHLDFACGTGRILDAVRDLASLSVGVDVSYEMVKVARSVSPTSSIMIADLTRSKVLNEQFDVITAFRFFPNAEDQLRSEAMTALERHLAPGGIIILNNHLNSKSLRYRLGHLLGRRLPQGMTHGRVTELAAQVGLTSEAVAHAGVLPSDERMLFLPKRVFRAIEEFASGLPQVRNVAQDIIYVCTRDIATGLA